MKRIDGIFYTTGNNYANNYKIHEARTGEEIGIIEQLLDRLTDGTPEYIQAQTIDGKRKRQITSVYYIIGLSRVMYSAIAYLKKQNYKDVTESAPSTLSKNQISYIINYSDGRAISLRVKNTSGKSIIIYNMDLLIRGCDTMDINKVVQLFDRLQASDNQLSASISSESAKIWDDRMAQCGHSYAFINEKNKMITENQSLDDYIRPGYFGGWCYCNAPLYDDLGETLRLDVHSLYPSILRDGIPAAAYAYYVQNYEEFKRESAMDEQTYFIHFRARFYLKKHCFPFVSYQTEWGAVTQANSSAFEMFGKKYDGTVEMTMAQPEFEAFQKYYTIKDFEYIDSVHMSLVYCGGYYVNQLYAGKQEKRARGDEAGADIDKMLLNGLIGGFGRRPSCLSLVYDKDMNAKMIETKNNAKTHLSIAAYITAAGRARLVAEAIKHRDRFLYCDTDSLHLKGWALPDDIKITDNELGTFGIEGKPEHAIFYGQKKYIEYGAKEAKVVMAGLPRTYAEYMEQYLLYNDIDWLIMSEISDQKGREWIDSMDRLKNGDAIHLYIPYKVGNDSTWLYYYPYKEKEYKHREERKHKEFLSWFGLVDRLKPIKVTL